jgi:hypothetical protein
MRGPRTVLVPLAAASWLLLAGCPLPQALPEYSAGSITPPRIVADDQLAPQNSAFDGAVTLVPAGCVTTAPTRTLTASIVDTNTVESVEARWFVNYDYRDTSHSRIWQSSVIAPNADTTNLERPVPSFTFEPYQAPPPYGTPALTGPPYPDPSVLRVVELVVSNGFDPAAVGSTGPSANRASKLPAFQTQVYRWVFLTVPESASVPCPTP